MIRLFMCGDVMTGRGVDQILPHAGDPVLHEPWVKTAGRYVELAEAEAGAIARPVSWNYVWGDALEELEQRSTDLRIANLETAVTTSDDFWPGKGIHYRMHPDNIPCLTVAGLDCCTLANNHVLDWGYRGLAETLDSLHQAGIRTAGAGRNRLEAEAPAVLAAPGKPRVLVYSHGTRSSGIPEAWAAGGERAGVDLLPDLSNRTVRRIADRIRSARGDRDLVVSSIHWGANWGYSVPADERRFARALIDEAGVDLVHGHSSHHPKGIEVHRDRLILYGCGDFLNDYEGIGGRAEFRSDLALMYFASLEAGGGLAGLVMAPRSIRSLRSNRASSAETAWLANRLSRASRDLSTRVVATAEGDLMLRWGTKAEPPERQEPGR